MDEKVFMKEGTILVSSSRIEINGQTFATRNVGSVKVVGQGVGVWCVGFIVVAVIALMMQAVGFGVFCLVLAALCGWLSVRRRKLMLIAGGGEVLALESTDSARVEQLRSAIADAIAVR